MNTINFIDLFAGMGGFRVAMEKAAEKLNIKAKCVFSSEIKPHAIKVYKENFDEESIYGDITLIPEESIHDFDILLAGFPCQAFSTAGRRHGFADIRGTLFFEIQRILNKKRPRYFVLENVDNLVVHDRVDKKDPIGETLLTMLNSLNELGYQVTWKVFNASEYGLAQARKRIFIVGSLESEINLENFPKKNVFIKDILENGLDTIDNEFIRLIFKHYKPNDLYGKSIKDKRGGKHNIHSWDLGSKGSVTTRQKELLEALMRARRNKKWAALKGIAWMDGMPLTIKEIQTFFDDVFLKQMLEDLVNKGYVRHEHPKDIVEKKTESGKIKKIREYRLDLEQGYNIVAGKLSFELNKILDPESVAPTLVATDLDRLGVIDNNGIRKLSTLEQKRLFGFPDDFKINVEDKEAFDLFGNTLPIPVAQMIIEKILKQHYRL